MIVSIRNLSKTVRTRLGQRDDRASEGPTPPPRNPPPFATKVVRPQSVVAPAGSGLSRTPPRPEADRQDGYLEAFDADTLFYDVFRSGRDVYLCGPPALDAMERLRACRFLIDGVEVNQATSLSDRGRTQRSRITKPVLGQELRIASETGEVLATAQIGVDYSKLFSDRKALMTLSKNNDLTWIRDWLEFYHRIHGVDAVVLYDNASEEYTLEDLQAVVDSVPGIEASAVVSWPFKYGPGGGPRKIWDSDFCQYSMVEHARWRFLRRAAGVVNADIDELVITDDGRTVFEHAAESEQGVALYSGRWVEKVTETALDPDRTRRFVDYRRHVGHECTTKWTMIPARVPDSAQWRVHSIQGLNIPKDEGVTHRHFKGINTNWKYDRAEQVADPEVHVVDDQLVEALARAFSADEVAAT